MVLPSKNTDIWQVMLQQNQTQDIYTQAQQYAMDYLNTVQERVVFPTQDTLEALKIFDEPLPEQPQNGMDILQLLHEVGSPATVAQNAGRYFGFVNGASIPVATGAKWLASVWDQNTGLYVMSPIVGTLEKRCEQWLIELFGLPAETGAGFVSGTSTATMCGLSAGRFELLRRLGWDFIEDGLFGAPRLRVVMSEDAHATVKKALSVLGIGNRSIEYVPSDSQGRLIIEQMPTLDDHTLVVLQAGNVNTGAFEDFDTICNLAREAGAWVHIDGAFGLWADVCSATKYLTVGIQKADSWSVDGHKTLNTPYDSGIVLCRDRAILRHAMQASGAYIQYSEQRDGMMTTPEMSRRARSVELWATLKFLGRSGIDAMIGQMIENAQLFGELLGEAGFRVLNEVVFNQVIVACDTPEHTQRTLSAIQASGVCWCGGSSWKGEPVIRISVCSWVTTEADVRMSVQAFIDTSRKSAEKG